SHRAPSTAAIYALSLHDALPISSRSDADAGPPRGYARSSRRTIARARDRPRRRTDCFWSTWSTTISDFSHPAATDRLDDPVRPRSEEHTSELQSLRHLVCRLLLE